MRKTSILFLFITFLALGNVFAEEPAKEALNKGIELTQKGKFDEAILEYNKAIAIKPNYAEAYSKRGNAYSGKGNSEQAISDYTKAIEVDPKFAPAYNNRGHTYLTKGNFDQATSDLIKAIEINPELAQAHTNLALVYSEKGKYDEAINEFNKAIQIDSKLAEAYAGRGFLYEKRNNHDQAMLDYAKAIEINPKYKEVYFFRGLAYYSKGKPDEAISDFTKAIEINPNYADAYNSRGNVYDDIKGKYDEAISDFTKAIEIAPKYAGAYGNRGIAYSYKGNYDQAISDCTKAIELTPNNADAYQTRGRAYTYKGNYDQAIFDLNKAIELNPNFVEAYYIRGNVYSAKGNLDQAISDYTKAVGINPKYAAAYNGRAVAYGLKNEYDKAKNDVDKAEQLGFKVQPSLLEALRKSPYANILANTKFVRTDDIISALSPQAGTAPSDNCLYSLNGMEVMQSTSQGVLMRITPGLYGDVPYNPIIAFLYTDDNFVDGILLNGYWGYYAGTYKYQTVLGVQKNIYAFKLFDKNKGAILNKTIADAQNESSERLNAIGCAAHLVQIRLGDNCVKYSLNAYARAKASFPLSLFNKSKQELICINEELRFGSQPKISKIGENRWLVSSYVEGRDGTLPMQIKMIRKYFTVDFTKPPHEEAILNDLQFSDTQK